MKQIVMLQGMGINERGWARLVSSFGRTVLIQQGFTTHVEIWENGQRTYNGPDTPSVKSRFWDELFLGLISAIRTLRLTLQYAEGNKIDVIVASNYNNSLAALLLRWMGRAKKVVPFLTDYLPPVGSRTVQWHRRLTTRLMEFVARRADEVWILSPRIHTGTVNPNHYVVPICINGRTLEADGLRNEVAYIGYPSKDHAIDILFDICRKNGYKLNIIGDSPYLQSIKSQAPPQTVFHGMINDEERIGTILMNCFCGYAIYRDLSPNSYSYYGFPSKTLYCFASNVPVVITSVAHFNQNFEKFGVGRVVEPVPDKIESAVKELKDRYPDYSKAINKFRKEWNTHVEKFHKERFESLFGEKNK